LLEKFKGNLSTKKDEDEGDDTVKIFYCSRTHSQLSQFAGELRRVTFPSSIPPDPEKDGKDDDLTNLEEAVKHLSLGSRKNLCINPKVRALENSTAINERCLDLQQSGVAADKKCSFLLSKDDDALLLQFRDHALATVKDIEDIGKVGKDIGICPYYASRSVIKHSEVSIMQNRSTGHCTILILLGIDRDIAISPTAPAICPRSPQLVRQGPRSHH
jgi:chromosome transmission fidelity protein 1